MRATHLIGIATIAGTVIAAAAMAPQVGAEPRGVISNSVQNQTTRGILKESNIKSDAVRVKTGDTLRYVVEVRNTGPVGAESDMYASKIIGTLPKGLELAVDPARRNIDEDLGVILPTGRVIKEYLVKVTATKEGETIELKACFSGDSAARDNPLKGCDPAFVRVDKTRPDALPTSPLPATGAAEWFAPVTAFLAGAAAYAVRLKSYRRDDQPLTS